MATNAAILAPAASFCIAATLLAGAAAPNQAARAEHARTTPTPDPLSRRVVLIPIAMTGTDGPLGPQLGAGVTFKSFDRPRISRNGTFGFSAFVEGEGVDAQNNSGFWRDAGMGLEPIVRTGVDDELGPGAGAGVMFGQISRTGYSHAVITDDGTLFFDASLPGLPSDDPRRRRGLWRARSADAAPIGLSLTDGPHGPNLGAGHRFWQDAIGLQGAVCAQDGFAAFVGRTWAPDGSSEQGIWRASPDGPIALAYTDPAAFIPQADPAIALFTYIDAPLWSPINARGDVPFFGLAKDAESNRIDGIWLSRPGSGLSLLVRHASDGPLGPDLGEGVRFGSFRTAAYLALNDDGAVAFRSQLTGPFPPELGNGDSVWLVGETARAPLAALETDGPLGPGLGKGVEFGYFSLPLLAGEDTVVFAAGIHDTRLRHGLWIASPHSLIPVMLSDDPGPLGPALGDSAVFQYSTSGGNFHSSGRGDIVFGAHYWDPIALVGGDGVWIHANGGNAAVALQGATVDIDPGPGADSRTIVSIESLAYSGPGESTRPQSGGQDGRPTCISDTREVALRLDFTDGSSGVFKARYFDPCPGDFNGDSLVDAADLGALFSAFGAADSLTDLNADGIVNTADLGALLLRLGRDCAAD